MIEVINLIKKYGNRVAVDDISFNVNKGEIVGFLGPNGAGKSTTMNILTGYISATNGTVKIDGIDILDNPIAAKKKIGYLPENPPLYTDMKVIEYLNFVYDLKKIKGKDKKTHINEICELVKITDVQSRIIKNLSKGYKQRVGLAQALIGNPELLILDEPTVGLDPKQIIEIRNLIKKLGETYTVILSSHILSEIQATCDKVIIISKGKIVANENTQNLSHAISEDKKISLEVVGDIDQVRKIISTLDDIEKFEEIKKVNSDMVSFVIYPKEDKDIRADLSKAITNSGNTIVELKSLDLSLEEIFLKLTDITSDVNVQSNSDEENTSNIMSQDGKLDAFTSDFKSDDELPINDNQEIHEKIKEGENV